MTDEKDNQHPIPENWVWSSVGQVYDVIGGGTPSTKNPKYWNGDIPWITSADIHDIKDIRPRKKVTKEGIRHSATNLVPEGSLIVVTRVGLGKVAITKTPLCFSQDSQALIGNNTLLNPEYSLYYLSKAVQIFKYKHRGTTIAGVTKKQLRNLPFPLPPFPEQVRIVSKLEELFTELDAGVKTLQQTKVQLQLYRQAVMKHAFNGRLTKEWRRTYKDKIEPASTLLEDIQKERKKKEKEKYREPSLIDTDYLLELPETWIWTRLSEIAEINPKLENENILNDMDVSFLPMKAVEAGTGHFNSSITKKYSKVRKGYTPFSDGDIIFAKITPCMENGKVAVVNNLKNGIGFGSTEFHVVRLINKNFPKKYVFYYILQERFRKEARSHMKGTAGQLRVPKSFMEDALIPLPSISEQKQITEDIENHLSVISVLEKISDQSLLQSERLRQSILKKTFDGKLVAQNPQDEPAGKLLELIEKEKENRNNQKRGSSRRKYSKRNQRRLTVYVE